MPRVLRARSDSCLIIQNKGGGHGEIGYHLALQLVKEKGMVRAAASRASFFLALFACRARMWVRMRSR
jgi:hypothetical protein